MNDRLKLMVVGVGGQGALTVAKWLGDAALSMSLNVMVGQLHGMSQRGGSVECSVLIGPGDSSYIGNGQADIILGLEPMEVLRALPKLSAESRVIINRGIIVPFGLAMRGESYPPVDSIIDRVRKATQYVYEVDGPSLVKQVGVSRSLNSIMAGAVCGLNMLPFDSDALWKIIESKSPKRYIEANRLSLQLGVKAVAGMHHGASQGADQREMTC